MGNKPYQRLTTGAKQTSLETCLICGDPLEKLFFSSDDSKTCSEECEQELEERETVNPSESVLEDVKDNLV